MNEVEEFIADFRGDNLDLPEEDKELIIKHITHKYTNGYCYYLAKILQLAFQRGDVVILAPFGHLVWRDIDGSLYDIYGKMDEYTYPERECEIPEEYLGDAIRDFLHRKDSTYNITQEEIDKLIKEELERRGETKMKWE